MPIRIPKHIARFLSHQVAQRIKLLESALLEIHDLDNRMKMELLALNNLAEPNDDESCENVNSPASVVEQELLKCPEDVHDQDCDAKYELVDLNDDVAGYEASINLIDKEIESIDIDPLSCYIEVSKSTMNDDNLSTFQTLNFLSGLINDQSLRLTSNAPKITSHQPVDIDHASD
ncbi:unnamed protein product [Heterobilharzia americana]|nr:unnamed protein product [Heterobilharzia americana]